MRIIELDLAMRIGDTAKADRLTETLGTDPLNPRPPHLNLIANPEVRRQWDDVLMHAQSVEVARRLGQPVEAATMNDIEMVTNLAADLVALFESQERLLARNERPIRLEETAERSKERARVVAKVEAQFRAYVEAGMKPPSE